MRIGVVVMFAGGDLNHLDGAVSQQAQMGMYRVRHRSYYRKDQGFLLPAEEF